MYYNDFWLKKMIYKTIFFIRCTILEVQSSSYVLQGYLASSLYLQIDILMLAYKYFNQVHTTSICSSNHTKSVLRKKHLVKQLNAYQGQRGGPLLNKQSLTTLLTLEFILETCLFVLLCLLEEIVQRFFFEENWYSSRP